MRSGDARAEVDENVCDENKVKDVGDAEQGAAQFAVVVA